MSLSKNFIFAVTFFIFHSAENYFQPAISFENSSYTYLKSNLEFLASDELEGRETTTRGEKIAALFISEELEKYGVIPYGDAGGYFQDFNMVVRNFSEESRAVFGSQDAKVSYFNGGDVIYSKRSFPHSDYKGVEYETFFVGYGIVSDEDNYDSYENADIAGKVVIVLNGTPQKNGKEILSRAAVRKFRWSSSAKAELAFSKGAVGLILLPDNWILSKWDNIASWSKLNSYNLESEINTAEKSIPVLLLNEKSSEALFKNEKKDYESIKNSAEPKPERFMLKTRVRMDYEVNQEVKISRNIIGLVEGNEEALSNEYVSIGAHYDHEGIKNGEVYYGADDNGSGTVTILEVARQLLINKNNKRPVLIMFHAAEEKGLKGSKYLTANSNFVDSIIVHFNFDMVGRKSEDSIYCIGASKISNQLGKLIEDVNSRTSNFVLDYKFDDPNDPQRLYYRSDHYNYAKLGIPIAFFYDYMKVDYTKPTDTVDKINFEKLLRITDLAYNLVVEISNRDKKLDTDNLLYK